MKSLSDAYEECKVLNNHYGTRFYHALNLFPKELQPHIHGLCAFDRILIEMIRNPKENSSKSHFNCLPHQNIGKTRYRRKTPATGWCLSN